VVLTVLLGAGVTRAEKRAIDVAHSVLKIRVYKSGLFSAFGHEHEIIAPIAQGTVDDSENPAVELVVEAGKLEVKDFEVSPKDRAEIQRTMLGAQVLDSGRYPEIRFRSTRIEKTDNNRWTVEGSLSLHGETHLVQVAVTKKDGKYEGGASLKQRAFGIAPVSVAGGAVKVKDEIKIEFQLVLAQ
jgi:hypothetical protein